MSGAEDVEDADLFGDDAPFEWCAECEQVYRDGASHVCVVDREDDDGLPDSVDTVADRRELCAADDGDPEDVVVYLPGRPDSAYHEVAHARDDRGRFAQATDAEARFAEAPACEVQITKTEMANGEPRTWRSSTRGHQRDRTGRFPCRSCHDLSASGDG